MNKAVAAVSPFDFVSVLLSIVISLALAHLLTGTARLIRARGVKFSLLYAGWLGIAYFTCIDYWFSLWQARDTADWTLLYVLLWLAAAVAIYFFAWLIVPEGDLAGLDLRRFHDDNRRYFLSGLLGYFVLGDFINMTVDHFKSLPLQGVAWIGAVLIAWIWKGRRVQFAMLAVIWVLTLYYATAFLQKL